MERQPWKMDPYTLETATRMAKYRLEHYLDHYEKLTKDPKKKQRKSEQVCLVCYYTERIGGAAMTAQPCGNCKKTQWYGSTATNVLCQPCATTLKLCKQCGADIELKIRRKNKSDNEGTNNTDRNETIGTKDQAEGERENEQQVHGVQSRDGSQGGENKVEGTVGRFFLLPRKSDGV